MQLSVSENNVTNCLPLGKAPDLKYKEFYETSQFITGLILYPTICIPGILANMITLIVLSKKNMLTSTNAFLSALAVSDSVKLLNDIIYFSVTLLSKTHKAEANKAFGYIYPYAHFIFNMSACISSWLTVAVAAERYIMVCHPVRARLICSRSRAITTSALIYFVMTCVAIPSAMRYKTILVVDQDTNTTQYFVEITALWQNETFASAYNWVQNFLRCNIPLLILITLNTCIINSIRKSRANKRNSARHRVTIMMVVVMVTFILCITPDAIMTTFFGYGYHEEEDFLVKGIREYSDTLLALNAAVNFVIYCLFSRTFVKNFEALFCAHLKKKKTELEEETYRRLSESTAMHKSKRGSAV
ncbi:FMRFamide receptor-like [Mytilus galloprovincialis]|uniref:Nociceptin receptor n=1 Tax=Mytilus galloprovincialis TaxID=29158 RepID=A0A8B6HDQ4_MYTGA|nr:nociceptin receptor [Mytilus galloprovincialis]